LDDRLVELEPAFVASLRSSSWLALLSILAAAGEKFAGFSPFFSMEARRANFIWFSFRRGIYVPFFLSDKTKCTPLELINHKIVRKIIKYLLQFEIDVTSGVLCE
jgi:hypothetical protein